MRNLSFRIILSLFTLPALPCPAQEPPANRHLRGLYAGSIEEVLELPAEEIDVGTAALIVSEAWSDMVAGRRYQQRLDDMALAIRSRLVSLDANQSGPETPEPNASAIPVINDYLFNELNFEPIDKADDPYDLFLHSVMDRRRGYCLSLSILYLAIGERLGLPLYGVVVPGHFFIRYDDGQRRFNIETTGKGKTASDEKYIEKFNVPRNHNTIYMANLNKLQTLGCLFNNLGNVYNNIGDTNQAMASMQWAVYINPSLAESRINLGNIYLRKNRPDDAITQYRAAIGVNPGNAGAYNNLGNAYFAKGNYDDAIEQYDKALLIAPRDAMVYYNLGAAYSNKDDHVRAVKAYLKTIELDPQIAKAHHALGIAYYKLKDYDRAREQLKTAERLGAEVDPNLLEAVANKN